MKEEFIKQIDDLQYKFGNMFLSPMVWEKVHGCIYSIILDYEDFIDFVGYQFMSIRHEVQDDFNFCTYYILLKNKKTMECESIIFADFVGLMFTIENERRYTIKTIIE